MEKKWTPGEWSVDGFYVISDAMHEMDEIACVEDEHNRNLFAAAPDLYEALELTLDAIGALSKPHELYGWGLDKDDIDGIFAALAKARGE
jgi:hypothetical protein